MPHFESLVVFAIAAPLSTVRFPSFCEGFGAGLFRYVGTSSQSSPLTGAFVVDIVDAFNSHSHLFSLVWPRLHPQVQSCHVGSELTFLDDSFPVLRDKIVNSARWCCTCSINLDVV